MTIEKTTEHLNVFVNSILHNNEEVIKIQNEEITSENVIAILANVYKSSTKPMRKMMDVEDRPILFVSPNVYESFKNLLIVNNCYFPFIGFTYLGYKIIECSGFENNTILFIKLDNLFMNSDETISVINNSEIVLYSDFSI